MVSLFIFFFLVGAVLAWRFRVWILIPTTALAMAILLGWQLMSGVALLTATMQFVAIILAPQLGYAFGLIARSTLVLMRSPRGGSVAVLFRKHSVRQAR